MESLRQMLKSTTEMPFIMNNEPFLLQEGYSQIYLQRMVTFKDCTLIFDEETEVIKALNSLEIEKSNINYSFVNSETDKYIQICDCIIACLSKTFKFLDDIELEEIVHLEIEEDFRDNLQKLKALIDRSDKKNMSLILNLNSQKLTRERYIKLDYLCQS